VEPLSDAELRAFLADKAGPLPMADVLVADSPRGPAPSPPPAAAGRDAGGGAPASAFAAARGRADAPWASSPSDGSGGGDSGGGGGGGRGGLADGDAVMTVLDAPIGVSLPDCDLVDLRAFIQSGLPSLGSSGGAHALTASRPALRLPPTPAPSGNLDQLLGPAGVPGNPGVPGGPGGSGRGAPAGPSPLGGAPAHLSGAGREGLRGPGAAGPPPGRPGPGGARQALGELKTSGSAASGLTAAAASMLAVPRPPGSPEHAPVMDGTALRQAREPRPPASGTASFSVLVFGSVSVWWALVAVGSKVETKPPTV